jgi:hypothetical protein
LIFDGVFKDFEVFGSFKRKSLNEFEFTPDDKRHESINGFEYQGSIAEIPIVIPVNCS